MEGGRAKVRCFLLGELKWQNNREGRIRAYDPTFPLHHCQELFPLYLKELGPSPSNQRKAPVLNTIRDDHASLQGLICKGFVANATRTLMYI